MALTIMVEGKELHFPNITRITNINQIATKQRHQILVYVQNENVVELWKVDVSSTGIRELKNYYRETIGYMPNYIL